MDATLHYRAAAVRSVFLPLRQATLNLTLDHGVLTVDPVAFSFPQGRFSAQVKLDARGAVPVTDADMRLSNISLQEFVPHAAGAPPPIEGLMAARVKLHGVGDSVHKAAAASNGAVTVVIPQGKIRSAFAELLGVNAGKGLRPLARQEPAAERYPLRRRGLRRAGRRAAGAQLWCSTPTW